MIKISIFTDISVIGFYGYIGYIGDISVDILYINIDKIKINKNKNTLIEDNIHNNLYRDSFVIVFKSFFFYQIHAFC